VRFYPPFAPPDDENFSGSFPRRSREKLLRLKTDYSAVSLIPLLLEQFQPVPLFSGAEWAHGFNSTRCTMPTPNSVTLIVPLPEPDYAAYTEAGRHLVRAIGSEAPDLLALVVHTLRCRDGRGLAEDYLESVGWPLEKIVRR